MYVYRRKQRDRLPLVGVSLEFEACFRLERDQNDQAAVLFAGRAGG
jgi:hypothetical protein